MICSLHIQIALVIGTLAMLGTATPSRQSPSTDGAVTAELVEQARKAMNDGDHAKAIGLYEQLRPRLPEASEVSYNAGVAAYRAGDLDAAATYFREALAQARSPDLQSTSAENLGHVAAQRVQSIGAGQSSEPELSSILDAAIRDTRDVLRHFRNRVRTNPLDSTARANAERAQQQLHRLQQIRDQLQQQTQQQAQPQEQAENQEQEQGQQQSNGNQSQEQQEQQQQHDSGSQQQAPDQSTRDQQLQQQATEAHAADQQHAPDQQEPDSSQPQSDEEQTQQETTRRSPGKMSDDEAERLLQRVRDRNRQRELQRASQQSRGSLRVDKDW